MKKFYLFLATALLFISAANAQYHLLPVVSNGQNPSKLNRDLENPQNGGLTSGWMTILQGPQPAGNWSSTFTIPFPFYFNGTLVRFYKASTTGIVTFNTKTTMRVDSNNIALPTSLVPDSSICVWGLRAAQGDFVVIKTFGIAPHRQLWISYNSFTELNLKSGHVFISIVLEEGTNKIFIVDQRSQCITNNMPCPDKTSLTLGIQIDSTSAIMVPGSPDYQCTNQNNPSPSDNSYYEFIPGAIQNLDVESQSHDINDYYLYREFPVTISGRFKNIGAQNINKVSYHYQLDNGSVLTDEISGLNVAPYEEFQITHKDPWQAGGSSYASHILKSWISNINDVAPTATADDSLTSRVIVNDTFITRKLMHENFTSSTSNAAKAGNDTLHSVLNRHPGLFTELNYPMTSFQGGDPYHTIEAAAKARFYSIGNTLPTTVINGISNISPVTYTSGTFASFQEVPSFYQIIPSGTVKDQVIDVRIEIKNEAPIPANTRLHVAICEKITFKNVKNNGETSFPHVMKKLIPDSLGTIIAVLPADSSQVFNLNWTVPGSYRLPPDGRANNIINLETEHSIEDFSNLEVIAWLQESNRNILQSNSASLDYIVFNDDQISVKDLNVFPNPSRDFIYVDLTAFDADQDLQLYISGATGQVIYADAIKLNSLFIPCSHWKEGLYIINVFGKKQRGIAKVFVTEE